MQLFDYMVKEKKKPAAEWSKKMAFVFVYKNQNYDDQQMRLLMSRLFQLIEEFLVVRISQQDAMFKKLQLARAYRSMDMEKAFEKAIQEAQKYLEKQSARHADYHRWEYELEFEYYDVIGSKVRVKETNLQQVNYSFDTYFIANKLKQGCLLKAHQMVFKKEYDFGLLDAVLNFVETHPAFLEHPAISIYYHCYMTFTANQKESHFQQLRDLMQQHQNAFSEVEIRGIYLLAINYCIRQLNTGEKRFIKEGFEMYRSGLQTGVLIEQNKLSRFTFNNIVALGIHLKEFQWVEQFIHHYKNQLDLKHREITVHYNLAKVYYEQKNYRKAMRLLAQFESEDYLLVLGAKILLVKMYFELEEWDALENLLESIRIYLQRKEVLSYHKKHFENIVFFVKKLMDLPLYDKDARNQMREQILKTRMQSEKEWLLKQL